MLVANRLMDPSSETTYARLGIGGSVNFPVQVLSSHALLQEQSSQDSSRRMLFPLKTDNFIRKKGGGGMCVCCLLSLEKIGYGGAATTC